MIQRPRSALQESIAIEEMFAARVVHSVKASDRTAHPIFESRKTTDCRRPVDRDVVRRIVGANWREHPSMISLARDLPASLWQHKLRGASLGYCSARRSCLHIRRRWRGRISRECQSLRGLATRRDVFLAAQILHGQPPPTPQATSARANTAGRSLPFEPQTGSAAANRPAIPSQGWDSRPDLGRG